MWINCPHWPSNFGKYGSAQLFWRQKESLIQDPRPESHTFVLITLLSCLLTLGELHCMRAERTRWKRR